MKMSQISQGAIAGLVGTLFSAPLTMHWGWMKLVGARAKYPLGRAEFLVLGAFILPVLFLVGFFGALPIAGWLAYQCAKADSLSPIVTIIQEPYQHVFSPEDQTHNYVGLGGLLGYSIPATFLALAMLDVIIGGGLGFLAGPGYGLMKFFFGSVHTFSQAITSTLFITTITSLLGIVGGGIYSEAKHYISPPPPPEDLDDVESGYIPFEVQQQPSQQNVFSIHSEYQGDNASAIIPLKTITSPALTATSVYEIPEDEPEAASTPKVVEAKLSNASFAELGQQAVALGNSVLNRMTTGWSSLWSRRNPLPNTESTQPLLHDRESLDSQPEDDKSEISFGEKTPLHEELKLPSPPASPRLQ